MGLFIIVFHLITYYFIVSLNHIMIFCTFSVTVSVGNLKPNIKLSAEFNVFNLSNAIH